MYESLHEYVYNKKIISEKLDIIPIFGLSKQGKSINYEIVLCRNIPYSHIEVRKGNKTLLKSNLKECVKYISDRITDFVKT